MSIVPNGFQDIVNDSNVGVNESTFFSFACQMTQMNAQKCYWKLILKNAKIVIESDLRANVWKIIRFQTTGGQGPKSWTYHYEPSVGENINKLRN